MGDTGHDHPLDGSVAAFQLAAAELGMWGASRLFVEELTQVGGAPLLERAHAHLGPTFPVFDVVAQDALDGTPPRAIDPTRVIAALGSAQTILIVGLEAFFIDALIGALEGRRLGLLLGDGGFGGDHHRIFANYAGAVEEVALADIHGWVGRRSALLTFVYGTTGLVTFTLPIWLRVAGPDIRPQFRTLVGWDVLGRPTSLYPRWLTETSVEPFSVIVGP